MTLFIGIDPGLRGALAFYDPDADTLKVFDVPLFEFTKANGGTKRVADLIQLAQIVDEQIAGRKARAIIEAVGARPGEAPSYAFTFGFVAGALNGICAAHFLSITGVVPAKWKRDLKVPADKDGARAVASSLLPQHAKNWPLKKHDGRAEASLIALWGSRHAAL